MENAIIAIVIVVFAYVMLKKRSEAKKAATKVWEGISPYIPRRGKGGKK
tara:strand:- start:239 stop:385 length:147 start_codon:yes stop_codon:yes gene_type:complete